MKAIADTLQVARSNLVERTKRGGSPPRSPYRKAGDAELLARIRARKRRLDRKQHEVAYGDTADAARTGGPGEDLAVVGVDRERDPHGIAVPARDLEHVRGPAPVRGGRRDLTVMGPLAATPGMARQQQACSLHHAVN